MKYYAFKKYGKISISGPFKTRAEAKVHGKPGHKCRICGEYAGGMSICRPCVLVALYGERPVKPESKPKILPVTRLFCTA